jgi:hypothetical protein
MDRINREHVGTYRERGGLASKPPFDGIALGGKDDRIVICGHPVARRLRASGELVPTVADWPIS